MTRAKRSSILWVITVSALSAAFAVDANADPIYRLLFDQAEYKLAPGVETVTVTLLFQEQVFGNDVHRITDTTTTGLTRGDVQVNWDAGGANVPSTAEIFFGSQFDSPQGSGRTATNAFIEQADGTDPHANGTQISTNPSIRQIAMGSMLFSVPLGPQSSTRIFFSDQSAGNGDLVIGSGGGAFTINDSQVGFGSARISNPEPSTFLLSGIGILGFAAVRRYRRRRMTLKSPALQP